MDLEGLKEVYKNESFDVERGDLSPLACSILDLLCDIVHITKDYKFDWLTVFDMTNHIVNLFYDNNGAIIVRDYLTSYCPVLNLDLEQFSDFFDFKGDRGSEQYKEFRSLFSESVIHELELADIVKIVTLGEGKGVQTVILEKSIVEAKIKVEGEVAKYKFGGGMIDIRPYLDNAVHVYKIDNKAFYAEIQYGTYKQKIGFDLGLLSYIVIADAYMADKQRAIATILQIIVSYLDHTNLGADLKALDKLGG